MRLRHALLILASLAAATPAFAQQTDAARRIEESQRQLEQYQQQQARQSELDQRLYEIERRQREADIQRQLDLQDSRAPAPVVVQILAPLPATPPPTPAELAAAEARHQAALDASNARLQTLADQINH